MKYTGWAMGAAVAIAALWFLGPRETMEREPGFDASVIGADPDAYLAASEAGVANLRPRAAKQIVWADPDARTRTPLALVVLHGFSASRDELRPVPDRIAAALGANLYFARLKGHGRDGAAMAEPRAGDWWRDTQEAVEIGRRLGERVVLFGSSTGATLATLAMADPTTARDVAGLVAVSPNYRFFAFPLEAMLAPFARAILPPLFGAERTWTPHNEEQARVWTTSYPSVAALPMAAVVAEAQAVEYAAIPAPALFIFDDGDQVADHAVTREVAAQWGGGAEILNVSPAEGEAPSRHSITGAIMAPSTVDEVSEAAISWIRRLN